MEARQCVSLCVLQAAVKECHGHRPAAPAKNSDTWWCRLSANMGRFVAPFLHQFLGLFLGLFLILFLGQRLALLIINILRTIL